MNETERHDDDRGGDEAAGDPDQHSRMLTLRHAPSSLTRDDRDERPFLTASKTMAATHVLVIHENTAIATRVVAALSDAQYTVDTAHDARAAFAAIDARRPDTVLLSLDLPGVDTIELCRRLRSRTRTPLIAISADRKPARTLAALDAGADDHLTAPLSMPELLARLRVALRHRRELASSVGEAVIHVGTLRLDPEGHAAAVGSRVLTLTPKEFRLLVLLARNADRVVAHDAILESIWPHSKSHDTLRLHVSQLRKKLAQMADAPSIVTEAGVGYRLRASV